MGYGAYLAHHGVMGMKWGHHKAMTNTGSAVKSKNFEGQGGGGGEPLEEETAEDIKGDIKELIREGVADEILYSVLKGKEVDTDAVNEALQKAAEKVPKLAKAAAKEKVQKAIDNAKAKLTKKVDNRPEARKVNVTGTGKGVKKGDKVSSLKSRVGRLKLSASAKVRDAQEKVQTAKAEHEKERNHKRLQRATKKAAKSLERYKKKKKKQEEYFRKHVTVSFQDAKITNDGHPGRDVKHSDISAYQNYLSHHGLSM